MAELLISNRKARYHYEILEDFEAGIVLCGTEVKSLRKHEGSLQEAYVAFLKGELFLLGAYIPPYAFGNLHNHLELRERKLLLHKNELFRLKEKVREKGLALVPLKLYLKRGLIKISFALAKGKKLHDKRADEKDKELKKRLIEAKGRYL